MSFTKPHAQWHIEETITDVSEFAQSLNISPFMAHLLYQRKLYTLDEARAFLNPRLEDLHNPHAFKQMRVAVERIRQAIGSSESIVIYGDYDVDGITSTALLYLSLLTLGAKVSYYIPNRIEEGYGLNDSALTQLAETHQVLISVDCGITAVSEVAHANALGLDIIITDHHLPKKQLPSALAVLNPHVSGESYPFSDLSGVGVALKLCHALFLSYYGEKEALHKVFTYLDIAALGTIADLVPLQGENRLITYWGLKRINDYPNRPGIQALRIVSKLNNKNIHSGQISFALAPRLNACGRLGLADKGVELLLTSDEKKAMELAIFLDQENENRRLIEDEITKEALAMLAEQDLSTMHTIVLKGKTWHHGVVGIVASRLVEKFYRPTILLCEDGNQLKGSARSIKAVHMLNALTTQQHLLTGFGGHAMAAGLSLTPQNFTAFKSEFEAYVQSVTTETDYQPTLHISLQLPFSALNTRFITDLALLEPFGMGNPKPLFMTTAVKVNKVQAIGQQKHLKLSLQQNATTLPYLAWQQGDMVEKLSHGLNLDVVYHAELNVWQGQKSVSLISRDFKQSQRSAHLIDARGEDKNHYINNLFNTGQPLLMVLFQYDNPKLSKIEPEPWGKPLRMVCDTYNQTAPLSDMNIPQDIVVYDLPYHMKQLKDLMIREDIRLHLLYNKNDQAIQKKWLTSININRELLNNYFKKLRAVGDKRLSRYTWDMLKMTLKTSIPEQAVPAVTLAVLNIFSELNLCHYDKTSNELTIYWSKPLPKVDLSQSRHYRFYQQLTQTAETETKKLLSWSEQEITHYLLGEA